MFAHEPQPRQTHQFFFSSFLFFLSCSLFSFFSSFFYFSSTFGLMTKCSNTVCTDGEHLGFGPTSLLSSQRAQYNVPIKPLYEPSDLLGSYDLVLSTFIFDCYSRSGPTRTCQTRTRCNNMYDSYEYTYSHSVLYSKFTLYFYNSVVMVPW